MEKNLVVKGFKHSTVVLTQASGITYSLESSRIRMKQTRYTSDLSREKGASGPDWVRD